MADQAPMAQSNVNNNGPIDDKDIKHWTDHFNRHLGDVSGTINQKSAEDAHDWQNAFFGCFSPIDNCLMTYCCPCVTFGKIHHRMTKSNSLEGYQPVNTSCLLFCGSACFGLHWILEAMQRSELRRKYHLKGSCLTDLAVACCCVLCDLTQQEKEAQFRENEIANGVKPLQYSSADNAMVYDVKN